MPIGSLQGSIRTRHTLPNKTNKQAKHLCHPPRHISKTLGTCSVFQNKASLSVSFFHSFSVAVSHKLAKLSPFPFLLSYPLILAPDSQYHPPANEPARENDRGCSAAISSPPRL